MGKIILPTHILPDLIHIHPLLTSYITKFTNNISSSSLSTIINLINYTSTYLTINPKILKITHSSIITNEGADFLAYESNFMKVRDYPYILHPITLPKILIEKFVDRQDYFNESERLIRIYLQKYNVSNLKCEIEKSVLMINAINLRVWVVLCGNVNEPEWMVLKAESKKLGVPNYAMNGFKDLKDVIEFLQVYDASIEALSFFKNIKKTFLNSEFAVLSGDYKSFELTVYDKYRLIGKLNKMSFRTAIRIDDSIYYQKIDILEEFRCLIEESLKCVMKRRISDLGLVSYDPYDRFIDDIEFEVPAGVLIKNSHVTSLSDIEQIFYTKVLEYSFFTSFGDMDGMVVYKNYNHVDFGTKNIIFRVDNDFFCLKLELVKGENIYIRLFCGIFLSEMHIVFSELAVESNPIKITRYADKPNANSPLNIFEFKGFINKHALSIVRLFRLKKFGFQISDFLSVKVRISNFVLFFKLVDKTVHLKHTCSYKDTLTGLIFTHSKYTNIDFIKDIASSIKMIVSFVILQHYIKLCSNVISCSHDSITFIISNYTFKLSIERKLVIVSEYKALSSLLQDAFDTYFVCVDKYSQKFNFTPTILTFTDLDYFFYIIINLHQTCIQISFIVPSLLIIPSALILKKDLVVQILNNSLYLRNSKKETKKNNIKFIKVIKNIYEKHKFLTINNYCTRIYYNTESIDLLNIDMKSQENGNVNWRFSYKTDMCTFQVLLRDEVVFEFKKQNMFNTENEVRVVQFINRIVKGGSNYLYVFGVLDRAGYESLMQMVGNN